jgi:hypothetical protein
MTCPKGYVSIFARDELREVPTTVDKLKELIMLLVNVWSAKV